MAVASVPFCSWRRSNFMLPTSMAMALMPQQHATGQQDAHDDGDAALLGSGTGSVCLDMVSTPSLRLTRGSWDW